MTANRQSLDRARDALSARFLKPSRRARFNVAIREARAKFASAHAGMAVLSSAALVADLPVDAGLPLEESHIHGIGIGRKNGTDEPAVVVYVTKKMPLDQLKASDIVPATLSGVSTDVVESPIARLASLCTDNRTASVRPLICGISVSRADGPCGTLGAFVRSTRAGDPKNATFLLSNSHVFVAGGGTASGIRVVQPGHGDGGAPDVIATVVRATRLVTSSPIRADAAIARLSATIAVDNTICSIGALTGAAAPAQTMAVQKHGRTSGLTEGTIKSTGLDVEVEDSAGRLYTFVNVFRVEGAAKHDVVALGGDSGSLVVEKGTGRVVGLLYAADPGGSYFLAHPIEEVFAALEVELKLD